MILRYLLAQCFGNAIGRCARREEPEVTSIYPHKIDKCRVIYRVAVALFVRNSGVIDLEGIGGGANRGCIARQPNYPRMEKWQVLFQEVGRVAFVLETTDPGGDRRLIEIVFLATERDAHAEPKAREPGLWPQFVPVDDTPMLDLRPPIAGYLRGLHRTRLRATAPYLGNLWREPAAATLDRCRGDRGG